MELESIGRNIRKYRLARKLRQEDLAEMTGLSTNYLGDVERCRKLPSLETFIYILNALEVSADMVLADVVTAGYQLKSSKLSEQLERVSDADRKRILSVVEVMLKDAKKK